jgi:competence protein ComEA
MNVSRIALLFSLGPFLAPSASLLAQADLPEGKGKDLVVRMCVDCHGLTVVTQTRAVRKAWARTVEEMVGRGAIGTDSEIEQVVNYLAAHFGKPVNVNKATAKEIQDGLSLTGPEAEAIVKYREGKGLFKTLKDLMEVPGIKADKLEEQTANIVF